MARTEGACSRFHDRERRRRVRRRLCHRSARHRYPRWDPGWRRSGRHRRSWFIGGNQRAPHLKTATTPCLAQPHASPTARDYTTPRRAPLPGHHRGRKGRPWALPTKILRRLVPLNVVSTLLGYTSVMTAGSRLPETWRCCRVDGGTTPHINKISITPTQQGRQSLPARPPPPWRAAPGPQRLRPSQTRDNTCTCPTTSPTHAATQEQRPISR